MNLLKYMMITALAVYRCVFSPAKVFVFGPLARCRFAPSCSTYAMQALEMHGVVRGSWLTASRLCRCHPWGGCGDDPVPLRENLPCATNGGAALELQNLSSPALQESSHSA